MITVTPICVSVYVCMCFYLILHWNNFYYKSKDYDTIIIHPHIYMYIYIYISRATVVEGDSKAFFNSYYMKMSWRAYSFPWNTSVILDLYLILLSVKEGGTKQHFLSLWYNSISHWTSVSRIIGEDSNLYTNMLCLKTFKNKKNQLPELIASAAELNIDTTRVQEHRY